jgi:hypothetical protein
MALRGSDFEHDPLTTELRNVSQRRFPSSSLIGAAVAIVVVALGGYAVYRFLLAGSARPAANGSPSADVALVQQQLDAISKRLERLEKQQRRDSEELADLSAKQAAAKQNAESGGAAGAHAAPAQKVVVVKQVPTPDPALEKKLAFLQNNTSANQQAWHATADQLADMAGQLGAAQGAIDQNQQALRQLLAGPAHSVAQFQLQRGAKEQRVGPVWLYLKSVDARRQRYTLEVLVNDRWTELKDRALNEMVEFFVPQFSHPLELVATDIEHNTLTGYLGVPTAKASH